MGKDECEDRTIIISSLRSVSKSVKEYIREIGIICFAELLEAIIAIRKELYS